MFDPEWDNEPCTAHHIEMRIKGARYMLWWYLVFDIKINEMFHFRKEELLFPILKMSIFDLILSVKLEPKIDPLTTQGIVYCFGHFLAIDSDTNLNYFGIVKKEIDQHIDRIEKLERDLTKMVGYIPYEFPYE